MHITCPQQALCSDRSKISVGVNPDDWISPSLPIGSALISFHFFVNWEHNPPRLGKEILLTRLVHFGPNESHANLDEKVLLDLFLKTEVQQFEAVERVCSPQGQRVIVALLPEIPIAQVNDETPVWLILRNKQGFKLVSRSVKQLKAFIQKESGGSVKLGAKGLTFGTSAVECFLSKTDAAYPGDVDMVACDSEGNIHFIIEYKKHTLDAPIGEHLAEKYYPKPDGRKYQRLDALLSSYREVDRKIPFIILYYSTKLPIIRLQMMGRLSDKKMDVEKDSGDLNISGWSNEEVATAIADWIGVNT